MSGKGLIGNVQHLRVRPCAVALAIAALAATGCARELAEGTPACERCHGGGGLAAPPRSVHGLTATTERAVGAHRQHLVDGTICGAIRCDECHVVPTEIDGHFGGSTDGRATVTFGELARARSAAPQWDHDAATCSAVYCHGATLDAGGIGTTPVWTVVDGTQKTCGSCHGYPPTNPRHPQGALAASCHLCHSGTVLEDQVTIDVAGGRHVNGTIDFGSTGGCGGCHAAPPATGAHRVHANPPSVSAVAYGDLHVLEDVSPGGGAQYDFGCGHCHPLDAALHMDGTVEVVLAPEAGAAGTLKARNAADAAFDGAGLTCSGVYCHSSGQETPAYAPTPSWVGTMALGCNGCHANPPRYDSGGVGAANANSHLVLASDGWESGHFGGMPGPWHTSKHGRSDWGEDAAPITCQTCHAETVDPASTAPGGFYWLDTTGNYDLGGLLGYACESCHTGAAGAPPQGSGKVLPLRHVNGRRDVIFDPRTTLPDLSWLPPAPYTPTRPYWVTNEATGITFPDPAIPDAEVVGTTAGTLSLHLASARYDASTKTCTSVACHLQQTQVTWGAPNDWNACSTCHPF